MTIEKILDKFKEDIETLEDRCRTMTDRIIYKFLCGEEIYLCNICKTQNMYEISSNKKEKWSMYKCDSCGKTHMLNWEDRPND